MSLLRSPLRLSAGKLKYTKVATEALDAAHKLGPQKVKRLVDLYDPRVWGFIVGLFAVSIFAEAEYKEPFLFRIPQVTLKDRMSVEEMRKWNEAAGPRLGDWAVSKDERASMERSLDEKDNRFINLAREEALYSEAEKIAPSGKVNDADVIFRLKHPRNVEKGEDARDENNEEEVEVVLPKDGEMSRVSRRVW